MFPDAGRCVERFWYMYSRSGKRLTAIQHQMCYTLPTFFYLISLSPRPAKTPPTRAYGCWTWRAVKGVIWASGLPTLMVWRSTLGPTSPSVRWSTWWSAWPVSVFRNPCIAAPRVQPTISRDLHVRMRAVSNDLSMLVARIVGQGRKSQLAKDSSETF